MDVAYYKFVADLPDGVYDNPHFGELVPGRTFEVRAVDLGLVVNHPDFEKSTKKQFENQPTIAEEHDRLATPATD